MLRLRVWMLTLAAALLVAGPALAYSWTALLGLPAVFGQESYRVEPGPGTRTVVSAFVDEESEFKDLLVEVQEIDGGTVLLGGCKTKSAVAMPYADGCPTPCQEQTACEVTRCRLVSDCLATWHRLWQQRKYRDAYDLAQYAAQAAPDNLDVRHALIVSQIVNDLRFPEALEMVISPSCNANILRAAAQYAPISSGCRLDGSGAWVEDGIQPACPPLAIQSRVCESGLQPAGTLTSDLKIPVKCSSCEIDLKCLFGGCPLTGLLEALFGATKECEGSVRGGCPIANGYGSKENGCANQSAIAHGCGAARTPLEQPPAVIWIVGQSATSFPPMSAFAPIAGPMAAPLPPGYFAPPPFPLPADFGPTFFPLPTPNPLHLVRSEEQEVIACPRPMPATTSSGKTSSQVRITQTGSHVHLTSPHYDAQCERIRGGAGGQMILEGNVRLMSRRHGQTMTIHAQRVMLNIKEDQFVVEQAQGMDSSRVHIAPVGYSAPGYYEQPILPAAYYEVGQPTPTMPRP
jgi:hypothetical protein